MSSHGIISIVGNPYDHSQHWRQSVPNTDQKLDCAWCGQNPARLFRYGVGNPPTSPSGAAFCNRECAKSYGVIPSD